MILKHIEETVWRMYQAGKAQANTQLLLKQDIGQKVKVLFSDAMRQRYYESKKMDEFNQPDYAFVSPILNTKRFKLSDADYKGKRRADMGEFDLYRLPKNSHFTNVYPVAEGCGNDEVGEITQVAPGEENFYINNADLHFLKFYVVKGRGIDTYHIPPCVTALDIETTYDIGDDTDIDMSIASQIIDQILGVALGIKKQYYSEDVQKQRDEQNIIK
jgi:hypothetical protein